MYLDFRSTVPNTNFKKKIYTFSFSVKISINGRPQHVCLVLTIFYWPTVDDVDLNIPFEKGLTLERTGLTETNLISAALNSLTWRTEPIILVHDSVRPKRRVKRRDIVRLF